MEPWENITNFRNHIDTTTNAATSRTIIDSTEQEFMAKEFTPGITLAMWDSYVNDVAKMQTKPEIVRRGFCCVVKKFNERTNELVYPNSMFFDNIAIEAQIFKREVGDLNKAKKLNERWFLTP